MEQEDASLHLHQAVEDKGDRDRYTQVTLVKEDDKPEAGEGIEQRRGESSTETTRKRNIDKETKEGGVVEEG